MIPIHELLWFALAAFLMVISLGPNMIYLISRSITQGKTAGLVSLVGVICGFLFHIVLAGFGLTAILLAVPFAYGILKISGAIYLLYLAYQAIKPNGKTFFEVKEDIPKDKPRKLFLMGFLTNLLNPKMAVFYLSFFPQFIKPEYGSILGQSMALGITQIFISFTINFIIVMTAAKMASFLTRNPLWVRAQKWFMASVLTFLAIKMVLSKAK
ncbi:LysE family translocator [Sphingobacterium thalpophilum]|uniref:Homoserine/homoserine lactone efflux protein n=1 Tax=Sphingobacterium thalpophilum TaxID=259 RepID=A0A4U9VJW1_9SPHI|nr:LysE family translocator [Sphingobacterium thalpophilum]VTR47420.1 Homoserine/homoserine lactone efflux protein [Sphingobacterium thalpophilum]